MEQNIDAGALRERLRVLELKYDAEANAYRWETARPTRGDAALSEKKNLFSSAGIGARDVVFTMRHRDCLTPANALSWRGRNGWRHCFITSIIPINRLYDAVRCALVDPVDCVAEANHEPTGPRFPGILTEKYVSHDGPDLHDINVTSYVLVTPKVIELKRGSIVTVSSPFRGEDTDKEQARQGGIVDVGGVPYHVLTGHLLDAWKNEFEIVREVDL